jgi:hypothetical protein
MALRRLAFLKKMPWLPETTRHRLSASLTRSDGINPFKLPKLPRDVFPPHPKDTLHQSVLDVHEILFLITENNIQVIV